MPTRDFVCPCFNIVTHLSSVMRRVFCDLNCAVTKVGGLGGRWEGLCYLKHYLKVLFVYPICYKLVILYTLLWVLIYEVAYEGG